MIDIRNIPELADDETMNALVETFNARLDSAETEHHYVGNWTPCVKIGPEDDDKIRLPTVRLVYACHKAELERARATVFAAHLLQCGRDEARSLWLQVEPWESAEFMRWCREDIEWKRSTR